MPPEGEADDHVDSDAETTDAESRHWLTNDAAAIILVLVVSGLTLLGVLGMGNVPDVLIQAYAVAFLVACVWLFGRGAAKYVFGNG